MSLKELIEKPLPKVTGAVILTVAGELDEELPIRKFAVDTFIPARVKLAVELAGKKKFTKPPLYDVTVPRLRVNVADPELCASG